MPQLPPQLILGEVSRGVITNVASRLAPQNSVAHAVNFVFDEVYGEPVTRAGTTLLDSQVVAEDNNVNGLFYYRDPNDTNNRLLAVMNLAGDGSQSIFEYNDTSWSSSLTGLTANLKTRFETFLGSAVFVNGTDASQSFNGTTWIASGGALDVGNMPIGHFVRVYKDQVVVGQRNGTLRISSVPNTAGTAISWTSGNRTIRVDPDDNSRMTGLAEVGSLLIIFKERGMYRFNNRSLEADLLIDVGCTSQESISAGADVLFFFNENGVWITNGGYPSRISRPVQRWIDGMSASYYENVAGHCDGKYYFCSIGDVTLDDDRTFNNVVLRYTIDTKEWAVFSYAHEFRVLTSYVSSSAVQIVGGDTTARVLQLNSSSLTDNGTNIDYELETHDLDFGSRGIQKEITERIMAYGLNPVDAQVQIKIEDGDWLTLGSMDRRVNDFLIDQTLAGRFFRLRVVGTHATARFRFQGFELSRVELLDYAGG